MIILIGMMGSGKSTIGSMLAKELNYSFIDTDTEIELRYGTIHELIRNEGIDLFREYEQQALKAVVSTSNQETVIATGGGVVKRTDNRKLLRESGAVIIYLKNSVQSLLEHLTQEDVSKRPLLKDDLEQTVTRLLNERKSLYEDLATVTIDCDGCEKLQVVEQIKTYLIG